MKIIKDKWNEPFIGEGFVSRTSFADDVHYSREEARRHDLDVTMLKERFELSDSQVQEFNSFGSERATHCFRNLLLRYLGKEKIPVISLDHFTREFMQTLQLKSSLDTVQLMQIVWVYTVLNVPRYDVLIVGPTDFKSMQAQENTFRITLN